MIRNIQFDQNGLIYVLQLVIILVVLPSVFSSCWDNSAPCDQNITSRWQRVDEITGLRVYDFGELHGKIYAITRSNGVLISNDQGATWSISGSGLPDFKQIESIATGENSVYVSAEREGIYSSSDGGVSWHTILTEFDSSKFVSYALAVSGTNIYAGIYGMSSRFDEAIIHSPDGGQSWNRIDAGVQHPSVLDFVIANNMLIAGLSHSVARMALPLGIWIQIDMDLPGYNLNGFGGDNSRLLASPGDGGAWMSTDLGATWVGINEGLTYGTVLDFEIDGLILYAATPAGAFWSINNGQSWIDITADLPDSYLLNIHLHGDYILVATKEHGIWRRAISDLSN